MKQILFIIMALIITGCSDSTLPPETRTVSEILNSIENLQDYIADRVPNSEREIGTPATKEELAIVNDILSEEFIPLYERYNGYFPFSLLDPVLPIEDIAEEKDQDFVSMFRPYYPQLQNEYDLVVFGSLYDTFMYSRTTGKIYVCHEGESLSVYTCFIDWLTDVESELKTYVSEEIPANQQVVNLPPSTNQ